MAYLKRAIIALANLSWFLSSLPGYFRFRRALYRPEAFQSAILEDFLRNNRDTEFGREHGFRKIHGWDDFRSLPLTTGSDYLPFIDRIMSGHNNVLTGDEVKVLQPTSGTTSEPKLIPFTKGVALEFRAALDAWISDLFFHHPGLFFGRQYWSISPSSVNLDSRSESAVRIGFMDDQEYFGSKRRWMLRRVFPVPSEVGRIPDLEANRYVTGLFLLRSKNLRLISIWHPSFLTIFLKTLRMKWDSLLEDMERGGVNSDIELPDSIRERLDRQLRPMPARADELRALDFEGDSLWCHVWPRLKVISCWRDGNAESEVSDLENTFKATCVQGKGLLATEGVVSIPFSGAKVCAITSHILEFEDEEGRIYGVWELTKGREYKVIITTGAGLCRYQLKDRVEVTGYSGCSPNIRFLGRSGIVSDLVGEKLYIGHVEEIIEHLKGLFFRQNRFAMLVPSRGTRARRYGLILESLVDDKFDSKSVAVELDSRLCENCNYAYARQLGQLEPAVVIPVDQRVRDRYRKFMSNRGGIASTVKFPALCNIQGIENWVSTLQDKASEPIFERK